MKAPHSYQLFTAQESRLLDDRTIKEFGIDGFTLMEIAGTRAADFILSAIEEEARGLICCGKGNNAGDALVVARILKEHNIQCDIFFVENENSLSELCSKNLHLLTTSFSDTTFYSNLNEIKDKTFDFIVDGMLGTGLTSDIRSPYLEVIEWLNSLKTTIFSMDIPTGLNADNGDSLGASINASYTLAFGTLKQGFYMKDGVDCCGEVILCELPFPSIYKTSTTYLLDEAWIEPQMNIDSIRAHKYDGGVVYVVAGSEGLTGAAIIAAKSAWSTGVGAVILLTPKGLLDVYEEQLPQIIKKPVGSNSDKHFKLSHLDELQEILSEKQGVLLIGPGIGRKEETIQLKNELINWFEGDKIIDADALYAFTFTKSESDSNLILTPHPGELSAILNIDIGSDAERLKEIQTASSRYKLTLLSKGLPSIVSNSKGETFITGYDTRIFSRAGFGDVLAGKISGYQLQYKNAELACSYALLEGKKMAVEVLSYKNSLEPLDII